MDRLTAAAKNLEKHGFHVQVLDTAAQAKDAALALIGTSSAGFGGSVTVRDMGLYETLQQQGNAVYWHWKVPSSESRATAAAAMNADVYICSANAVIETGALLNIDGTGNRVNALNFGPKLAIVIAGENKLAPDYTAGLDRIKRIACPANARRLNLKTPCAITGVCSDCSSPQRICCVTSLLERPTVAVPDVYVLLVRENLGY